MNDFITNAGYFVAGAITLFVLQFAWSEWRYRREVAALPAEPVAQPEPMPVPEPEPTREPEPVPVAAEVVFIERRPAPDLLPLPEPHPEEVPIFRGTPVPLPAYASYGFHWKRPKVDFPTGTFPVVVLGDDIEGYQVSEVPAKQRAGFEVDAEDRRRLSLPEDLVDAVTSALPSSRKASKAEVSA